MSLKFKFGYTFKDVFHFIVDIQVSSSILAVNLNFIQQLFLFSSEPSETYDSAKETNSEVKDLLSLSLVGRIQVNKFAF